MLILKQWMEGKSPNFMRNFVSMTFIIHIYNPMFVKSSSTWNIFIGVSF